MPASSYRSARSLSHHGRFALSAAQVTYMTCSFFLRSAALLALFAVLLQSCKHEPLAIEDIVDDGNGGGSGGQDSDPVDTCDQNTAYFAQEVLPIFIQSCTMSGCHNAPTDANDEIDLTSYNAIVASDVISGDLWEALTENDNEDKMPPDSMNQLSADQLATINAWLQQGAQNNSCESGCDTSAVTYSGTIFPLIQQRCLNCHSGSNPQGDLNFGSWAVLNSVATDGRLAGAIQHQVNFASMPPSGPMLSQCRIDQVLAWIQDGSPNN